MPRASRIAAPLALLAATALAGCQLAPAYAPPSIVVPAVYKEGGDWAPAQPDDDAARGAWWRLFDDPTLDDLEAKLDASNPDLAAALSAYDQATALAAQASSSLLPTVTGLGAATANRQSAARPLRGADLPNDYANNQLGAEIDYEFDFWGRVRDLVASGRAQAQATGADLATARLSLQAALADDYLQLRGLDAQSALLAHTVAAYQRALTLTTTRHSGGVSSGLDVDRAAAQLANVKAQVSDVSAQRAVYEHAIAVLVGAQPSTFSIAMTDGALNLPMPPPGAPSTLLQRRPDVAAAERRAYAANRLIGVAKAAYFPTLTLDAQGGFQNTGGDNLLIAPNTVWTLGPELAMTLFDGGRRKAGVRAAKAVFEQASANYRAVVLSAFQQVEDQLALSHHLAVEAQDQAGAVTNSQAATHLSLIRYREGATNYLDVVTAQTAELQARQVALALETRRQQASVNLVKALGGGWRADDLAQRDRGRLSENVSPLSRD
jgi:NodT family efflux transporter outer membrane factor (OMF) lipoprotein